MSMKTADSIDFKVLLQQKTKTKNNNKKKTEKRERKLPCQNVFH